MSLRFNPRFDERFGLVADYLRDNYGIDSSNKFKTEVLRSCHLLEDFPRMGRLLFQPEDGLESDFRVLISGMYLIIYVIDGEYVEIMSLIDSRTEELQSLKRMVLD